MLEFNQKLIDTFSKINKYNDDYFGAIYLSLFNKTCVCYRIFFDKDGNLIYKSTIDSFNSDRKNLKFKINDRLLVTKALERSKNDDTIRVFCYRGNEYMIIGKNYNNTHYLMNITCTEEIETFEYYIELFTDDIEFSYNNIKDLFVKAEKKEYVEFGIAAIDSANCVFTSWYSYDKECKVDIKRNYNDDFEIPYENICSIVEEENTASLMLFYGEPGTGKSTIIKHLIAKYPDKDFIFMDGALLAHASQEKLMAYFLENNNTVFILEDCEKALLAREHYVNPVMPVLLNLTDGIISDVLGIKFICTFNTDLSKIDKALIRKGRLKLKYEFKKLAKEKCQKIVDTDDKITKFEVKEDMSLADLYNHDKENDYSKKSTKKIGF